MPQSLCLTSGMEGNQTPKAGSKRGGPLDSEANSKKGGPMESVTGSIGEEDQEGHRREGDQVCHMRGREIRQLIRGRGIR